jgi:hypothetical protein
VTPRTLGRSKSPGTRSGSLGTERVACFTSSYFVVGKHSMRGVALDDDRLVTGLATSRCHPSMWPNNRRGQYRHLCGDRPWRLFRARESCEHGFGLKDRHTRPGSLRELQYDETPSDGSVAGRPSFESTVLTVAGVRPLLAAAASRSARAAAIAALRAAICAGVAVGIPSAATIALW